MTAAMLWTRPIKEPGPPPTRPIRSLRFSGGFNAISSVPFAFSWPSRFCFPVGAGLSVKNTKYGECRAKRSPGASFPLRTSLAVPLRRTLGRVEDLLHRHQPIFLRIRLEHEALEV